MKIRARFRISLVRTITTTLFLSLFTTFPVVTSLQAASAATTITKTVTIKGSNNVLYNGAGVSIFYYVDGDLEETIKPLQTTGSSGQVTITYPSNAAYAQMFITPPVTDTTNAVQTIDLLTSTDAAITNVTLKASNIRVEVKRPDGTAAGLNTCVDYPKQASSRWVTTQFRTTRTGAFGIAIPSTLNSARDYHIQINPCNKEDYKYLGTNYGLRRAANGTISLYTNDKFTTLATASSGVYTLTFEQGLVRGSLIDTNGNAISLPTGTYAQAVAVPIFANGSTDWDRNYLWSEQTTTDGKFAFNATPRPGIYSVSIRFNGLNPLPTFTAGRFWVNNEYKFSTTETGTYTSSLDLVYTVPNTGLTKFKFVDSAGNYDQNGGQISYHLESQNGYKYSPVDLTSDSTGVASARITDGTYALWTTPRNSMGLQDNYTLSVVNNVATLRNSAGTAITKVGDYFPIQVKTPSLKFRIVSPLDSNTSLIGANATLYSADYNDWLGSTYIETNTAITRLKAEPGSYALEINPNRPLADLTSTNFTIDIDSVSVVVKNGTTVINPVDGIYNLAGKRPMVIGEVLNPAGTESVRFAEIRAVHTTYQKFNTYEQSNSAGLFSLNLPADGTYQISAIPPLGVNANYGISDSVTVTVTNGLPSLVSINIRLRTANISGVVSGPNGVAPNNWMSVSESRTGTWLDPTFDGPLTDEDGGYSLYLPTGTYGITPSSDYANTGGVATTPKSCVIGSNPSTAVTCNVPLTAPNVTGTVTIGGEKPAQSSVGFRYPSGKVAWSGWSDINNYGINLESGTYRMLINYQLYSNGSVENVIPGPLCTVTSTGTFTCDAAMPATNLNIQVANWTGNAVGGNMTASLALKEGSQYFAICCSYADQTVKDGKIRLGLLPGSYKVTLSDEDGLSNGTAQTYFFTVSAGGSVSNMSLTESGTVINPVNGIYTLALKEPAVTGTLYGVDGTTPEPYTNVKLFNSTGQHFNSSRTDRLGRFTFEFDEPLANGTYYLMAEVYSSLTKGNSKVESFTILNGKATSSLSLKLNVPNFVGVASGPLKTSPNSYIGVSSTSNNMFAGKGSYTFTDSSGKFAFYLPTGTYSLYGETDFDVTGGVSGSSQPCVVSAETTTVCNITFAAPNVTGTASIAGATTNNSHILFFPAYGIANNPARDNYGWIYMSRGKYGIQANPGTYRTYILTYPASGQGKYQLIVPGPLCVVPATGSVVCNATLPATNFTFRTKSATNVDLTTPSRFSVEVKNGDQYQSAGSTYLSTPTSVALSLVDGSYRLRLDPEGGSSLEGTSAQYTFDVTSGTVTNLRRTDSTTVISPVSGLYNLPLVKPNVSGTVTGPKGVAADTYIEVRLLVSKDQGGYKDAGYWAQTNAQGKFALSLPVGTYILRSRPDFAATGGGDTSVKCEVTSETSTSFICDIQLIAPNVIGTVRAAGAIPQWGSVLLQPAKGIAGNTATEWYGWTSLTNGTYGLTAKPGTYRINVSGSASSNGNSIPAGLCVVPETGTATCNVNMPSTNFVARVLDAQGNELSNAQFNLTTINDEGTCCNYLSSETKRLNLNLVDGTYGLQVSPTDGRGGSQGYILKIETGTVTSLKATGSNVELVATSGLYTLRLRPPTFSGTVYKSDGTTVAPLALIEARDVAGKWSTSVESDSLGKFILDVPTGLDISRVNITAYANRITYRDGVSIDKTLGRSITKVESITAGLGNQSLTLSLRKATINGRVSGSKGALVNSYIQIQQLDGSGNWNWMDFSAYTDKNGEFAEYLPTGTYRLYSYGDSKGAGGGETYGNPCTVNTDSATAAVCNLTLTPPNTSGTVKLNSVNISWGQIQFSPDQGISRDTPRRNYYFYIDQGSYSGNLQPDTYQTSIWFSLNGKYVRTFGPKCVVPENGIVACDANLPVANFAYKVLDSNNTLITSSVYSTLQIKSGNNWNEACCSYPDETLRDGKFENTLINGTYRLTVRPSNSSVAGTSRTYTFIVESATVKNFSILGSTETISAVSGIFTTKLTPAAISGTILKSNGTTGYANARVCMREASTQKSWWYACTSSNESGKYTMDQSWTRDGIWEIQAFSTNSDLLEGSSIIDSITVASGLGSKIGNLTLRAPNFTGVVSGPRGVSPNNYINVRKYFDNGEYTWIDSYFQTDSQGRFAFTLEPGRYRAVAGNDMAVAGGTTATSSECIVTSGSSTACNISLVAPNVTGTVRIGGTAVEASVEFLKETNYGKEQAGYSSTDQNGNYALNVPAGTYRPRIYLYASGNYILGPPCVVQANVNATCDINLPSTNIRFKVNKALGGVITSGLYVGLSLLTETTEIWAGNARNDETGLFRGSLIDGKYRIDLSPDGSDATLGTYSSYKVTIESGTVTSFTRDGSTLQLVATAGVFTLTLTPPSISGTVVAPDGTTPVPNSRVYAFTNPYNYNQTGSDKNATFGFAKLPDGTYSVIAAPGWEDATKAQSAPQMVTITNGLGVSDLRLVLRTPNVSGVVRGPTSKVSIRNWLDVSQKMEGNWWQRPDYFTGAMTSPEGSFGFYLAPGTYRIRANGDMDQAGGVSTSTLCVVPETGTVTCNITLKAPNLRIRVVAPSGTTAEEGSYAWGYLQSATDESAILNRNPSFQWINGGNLETVLEDGTWVIRTEAGKNPLYSSTQFTVDVAQGVVTRVANANNETVTATNGVYLLPLIGSNLTGSITFNGAAFEGSASVHAYRQDGEFFNYFAGKWIPANGFGFTLPAGNYKIEAVPYSYKGDVQVSTTRSDVCVVEATGTTTCNIALKSPNLKGKITDQFGAVARFSDAYILLQQARGERWVRWLELREGLFDTYLEDGTYRIQVMPRWEFSKTYTDRSYIIKIESGTVQSVTDLMTLLAVSPTNGTYSFMLGTPSVTGKVFNPGSTTGAAYINIQVAPSSSPKYWRYSTQSDANGDFALKIPDGTYVIQAVPNSGGFQFGKSETRTITISNNVLSGLDSVTLVLRQPNFTGRVVIPNTATPLANVNVNINIDGEYAYGWTDSDGRFGAYIDNPAPTCPSRCSVYLNYYKGSEYTPKYHAISAVGNVGDLAIGGVSSILTVLIPQSSGPALPSTNSWVTVEEVAVDNSRSWVTSGNTNDLGRVGLSLTTGRKYVIWAYPNGEQSRSFAPKKLEITNYSPDTHSVLSTTFALPNVKVKVLTSTGGDNVYGWFTVSSWDSLTSTALELSNGSLDSKGYAALTLDNGNYQLRFWPGKGAKGVQKIVRIKVDGTTITTIDGFIVGSDSLASSLVTAKLPSGNISGVIRDAASTAVPSALVAAYRSDDSTKFVTTSTDANGNYMLNLDLTYSWIVKSVDPVSGYAGSLNIASRSPSNDVLANQNISLSTPPAS